MHFCSHEHTHRKRGVWDIPVVKGSVQTGWSRLGGCWSFGSESIPVDFCLCPWHSLGQEHRLYRFKQSMNPGRRSWPLHTSSSPLPLGPTCVRMRNELAWCQKWRWVGLLQGKEKANQHILLFILWVSHIDLDERSYLEKWGKLTFSGQLPLLFRRNTPCLQILRVFLFYYVFSWHSGKCVSFWHFHTYKSVPLIPMHPPPLSSPKPRVPLTYHVFLPDSPSFLFSWHICTKKTKWGHL